MQFGLGQVVIPIINLKSPQPLFFKHQHPHIFDLYLVDNQKLKEDLYDIRWVIQYVTSVEFYTNRSPEITTVVIT